MGPGRPDQPLLNPRHTGPLTRPTTAARGPPSHTPENPVNTLRSAVQATERASAATAPDTPPSDLADAIRVPDQVPHPPADLYPTKVAAVLQRAHRRLERDGWCAGATVDEDGRRCLYGALRAEAASPTELDTALAVLLETIRRHYAAQSVPDFNDRWTSPRTPLRVLEQAADLAHARGL